VSSYFKQATKDQLKLRLAQMGVSGSGKTFTSLVIASGLGKNIYMIDTERGKSRLYSDLFDFQVVDYREHFGKNFDPRNFVTLIKVAEDAGADVIISDSLSHAWDGTLELKDNMSKRNGSDSFTAWRDVNPIFNELIDAIIGSPAHMICNLRQKQDYAMGKSESTGKNKVDKLGMAPVFRDGVEYEFDVVADMDVENNWIVTKTRYSPLQGRVINRPTKELAEELLSWLNDGTKIVDLQHLLVDLSIAQKSKVAKWTKSEFAPSEAMTRESGWLGRIFASVPEERVELVRNAVNQAKQEES